MTNHQQDNNNEGASLARPRKHFTVSASPLNAVKLDLAIIIIAAVIVVILVSYLLESDLMQILSLLGFGLLAMAWLIIRARKVLLQHRAQDKI